MLEFDVVKKEYYLVVFFIDYSEVFYGDLLLDLEEVKIKCYIV